MTGIPMHAVEASTALRRDLGQCAARLARGLRDFSHPAANHKLLWDLQHAAEVRPLIDAVAPDRRGLVEQFLDGFETRVLPALPDLPRQPVHNDLNPHNIVVDAANNDRISGIIDFGDLTSTARVNDLAITAAYQVADSDDPLAPARELIAAYHAVTPLNAGEFDVLFDLIATRMVMTIVISSWRAARYPENRDVYSAQPSTGLGAAQPDRKTLPGRGDAADPARLQFGVKHMSANDAVVSTEDIIARRNRLLGPAYRLFYEQPVHFVRGEGVWLYDPAGNRYLDAYNNVASVGHCHPHVVEAIARQAGSSQHPHALSARDRARLRREAARDLSGRDRPRHVHLHRQRGQRPRAARREDLHRRDRLHRDGNRLSRRHRCARRDVALAWAAARRRTAMCGWCRRHDRPATTPAKSLRAASATALDDMKRNGIRPAGLLVDTIFSSDGVFADPPGFLRPAVEAIRAAGGLFIADEVQPGFGRTGEQMWGFARHGLVPDLVTMGKPMGNGHPIAGMAARPDLLAEFGARSRYFNTFGGNPVSAAAGIAVLEVIESEGLMANAQRTGAYLLNRLRQLQAQHALIAEVRGAGLFIGVELRRGGSTRHKRER